MSNIPHHCGSPKSERRFVGTNGFLISLWATALIAANLHAQPIAGTSNSPAAGARKDEQLAAAELEMTNAWSRVLGIVNQPVRAFARAPGMDVSVYSPGWFHDGATKPDFAT